jgi:DNA-binding MarR family transcriptional regulator
MANGEAKGSAETAPYRLDDQVGYVLRRAHQRHTAIFGAHMLAGLTPMQFAALARLAETGPCSQNRLGRLTAMDVATIKGVVDRLRDRGLVRTAPDPEDRRRSVVALTEAGATLAAEAQAAGRDISRRTLAPLTERERATLLRLLGKIAE